MIGVLYHSHDKVNGSLIDAFEYFIALLEAGGDAYLFLIKGPARNHASIEKVFSTFEDRYDLGNLAWKHRVKHVKHSDMPAIRLRKALIVDFVTPGLVDGVLNVDEVVCIEERPLNPGTSTRFTTKVFSEIRNERGVIPYKMKMLLEKMKTPSVSKQALLVNVAGVYDPNVEAIAGPEVESFGKEYITKTGDHKRSFFSLFDEYLYVDTGVWDDPHPRLFHECAYMGKDFHYINIGPSNTNRMARARFSDAKINGTDGRSFDDDQVIQELMR